MHRDGSSIAEISRKTNVSEPTVRKYVRMEDLSPKIPAKRRVPSMLDDYAPLIDKWLEEDGLATSFWTISGGPSLLF